MKQNEIKKSNRLLTLIGFVAFIAQSCSNVPLVGNNSSGKDIAATGPSILNAHSEPSTIELNQSLVPFGSARVVADVKDFTAPVEEVRLKFTNVPLSIPMQNIGGTTWVATLSQTQLQNLAVRGKTINYDTEIYARDQKNQTVTTSSAVTIAIKAPETASSATG